VGSREQQQIVWWACWEWDGIPSGGKDRKGGTPLFVIRKGWLTAKAECSESSTKEAGGTWLGGRWTVRVGLDCGGVRNDGDHGMIHGGRWSYRIIEGDLIKSTNGKNNQKNQLE